MSKMLTSTEVIELIEVKFNTKIWHVCMVGEMGAIEGTDYKEIMIGTYHRQNLKHIKDLLSEVLNVTDIKHTGHAKPALIG